MKMQQTSSVRPARQLRASLRLLLTLAVLMWCAVPSPSLTAAEDRPLQLVAFGDSLSAGFMLPANASFPAQLQVALRAKGYKVDVINAGVSGDTSAGGVQRLDWSLQGQVDGVILELGANDALRGIDPELTRVNLDKLITRIKAKGAQVLLAGMKAPANWGPEYQAKFDAVYGDLAAQHGVALYPFFLANVLGVSGLTMDDGLHPTEKGVAEIVRQILPDVEAMIARIRAGTAPSGASAGTAAN